MPFLDKQFEDKFNQKVSTNFPKLKPLFEKLKSKFYTYCKSNNVIYFIKIECEFLKFLEENQENIIKFTSLIEPKIENGHLLKIELRDKDIMISLPNFNFSNNGYNIYIETIFSEINFNIFIKNDYEIFSGMYKKINKNYSFFEMSLSYIAKICKRNDLIYEFFIIYFEYLQKNNTNLNDIIKDFKDNPINIYSAFKFSELKDFKNKKYIFASKYPKETFFNHTNKYKLITSYINIKIKKYIPKEYFFEVIKFLDDNIKIFEFEDKKIDKSFIITLLSEFWRNKNLKNINKNYDKIIVYDYIKMMIDKKEKINLNIKSFKRIKQEHDRIALENEIYYAPNLKISKGNQFLKLKLPKEIKRLSTKQEIIEEGVLNRNCVASYIREINKQICMIYSLRQDDKRYTIEIRQNKNGFYLRQIKGFANSEAPKEIIEFVKNEIEINNVNLLPG